MHQPQPRIYRTGEVPAWDPRNTGHLPEITAGMSLTRELLRYEPPPPQRDSLQMLGRVLMVVGILSIMLVCAGLGLWMASTAFCPCTIGGP